MIDTVDNYINEVESFNSTSKDEIEQFRIKFLSKKGIIPALFSQLKNTGLPLGRYC